jgi:hypothetical protein
LKHEEEIRWPVEQTRHRPRQTVKIRTDLKSAFALQRNFNADALLRRFNKQLCDRAGAGMLLNVESGGRFRLKKYNAEAAANRAVLKPSGPPEQRHA